MRPVTRRDLLIAGAAALPAALAPLRPWRALVDVVPPPAASIRLAGALGSAQSARAVGRAELALRPAGADELAASLSRRLRRAGAPLARLDGDGLRAALARCVGEDFAAADVVDVDGWVLSRTEAQLCALAALTDAGARQGA